MHRAARPRVILYFRVKILRGVLTRVVWYGLYPDPGVGLGETGRAEAD